METETLTALCDCVDLPDHGPTCPANPSPVVCEGCAEPFDPDAVDAREDCYWQHCGDCLTDCSACTRHRYYI